MKKCLRDKWEGNIFLRRKQNYIWQKQQINVKYFSEQIIVTNMVVNIIFSRLLTLITPVILEL